MSLSRSIDVVRRCRPPIPPLQPRIRSFMVRRPSLFLVEHRHPVPVCRRGIATLASRLVCVEAVEGAIGIHALKVQQADFDLIPLPGPILSKRLLPQLELVQYLLFDVGFHPDRLVDRDRLILALYLDFVDLLEDHVLDELPAGFSDQYADPVVLRPSFQPGGDVDGIAHGSVCLALLGSHVAHPDASGVDSNSDFQGRPAPGGELLIQGVALAQHLHRREDAVARVSLVFHGSVPEAMIASPMYLSSVPRYLPRMMLLMS